VQHLQPWADQGAVEAQDVALGPADGAVGEPQHESLFATVLADLGFHHLAAPDHFVAAERPLGLSPDGVRGTGVELGLFILDTHEPKPGGHGTDELALESVQRAVGLPAAAVDVAGLHAKAIAEVPRVQGGK
jgi:hypothetical protein